MDFFVVYRIVKLHTLIRAIAKMPFISNFCLARSLYVRIRICPFRIDRLMCYLPKFILFFI